MSKVINLLDAELAETHNPREGNRFLTRGIGAELGATLASWSVYELPPGNGAGAYHYELSREEWLLVVSGRVTVRTPDGERVLGRGDVVCFAPGPEGAHAVRNDGPETARVAMASNMSESKAIVYPDSGRVFVGGPGFHRMMKLGEDLGYWEGEP